MLQTGSITNVQVPRWFAKQNECPTEMEGRVIAETDHAIRFRGHIPTKPYSVCVRCGRDLTHPVSVIVGIGPECAEHWGIDRSRFESMEPAELTQILGEMEFDVWIPKSLMHIAGESASPATEASEPTFDYDRLATAFKAAEEAQPTKPVSTRPSLADRVEKVFRETFATKMPGYEAREPQIQMARLVAEGFDTGQHTLAEAGTGTGKSFGVLVPSVLHSKDTGQPAIVSTGTIALQEQYVQNDIPFLQEIMDKSFTAVLAKGKSNYVCKLRLEDEVKQEALFGPNPLVEWAKTTETGDIADYEEAPDPAIWHNINVDDACVGRKCPFYGSCHYFEAKRRANEADIVICNHHLFMADLQVRTATAGMAGVLPPACAVVFDEAHHVESIARDSLGVHISNYKMQSWIGAVKRLPTLIDPEDYSHLQATNDRFFMAIATSMEDDRGDVPAIAPNYLMELESALSKVMGALNHQSQSFSEDEVGRAERLLAQGSEFLHTLRQTTGVADEPISDNHVLWAEREQRGGGWKTTIHLTPIDVAPILRESLFGLYDSVALTSATISVANKFDHIKNRLGIDHALELNVDSPFNYRENCLLYVPKPATAPDPSAGNPDYHYQIAPMIEEILLKTDGRAFVLFTSYRGMNAVYDLLADRLRWQILRQGDAPRSVLVDRFKADKHSVLFGTKTFWEGISIEGEALSAVIIDKLPFSVPSDPVEKAIASAVERRGGKPFFEISLPEAVLSIKQGFGRLIRTRKDRGIVAILDKRIRTKGYGRTFLNSLPRAKRIEVLDGVEDFLNVGKGVVA